MGLIFTALIPIAAAAIIVLMAKGIAAHTFTCKHCAGEFRIKWPKALVTAHSDRFYLLTCPHCKTKDWCAAQVKPPEVAPPTEER